MKRVYRAVAAAALMSASGAWAVKVGDNLYIKGKGVKLLKEPKATSSAVGKELGVGDEVKWQGPSDKDKTFHKVEINKQTGFVLMSSLSTSKVQPELDATTGKSMDAKAFASSGAATKALTPAGVTYAKDSASKSEAAAEIIYAEQHNIAKGTKEAVAKKSAELGGAK